MRALASHKKYDVAAVDVDVPRPAEDKALTIPSSALFWYKSVDFYEILRYFGTSVKTALSASIHVATLNATFKVASNIS